MSSLAGARALVLSGVTYNTLHKHQLHRKCIFCFCVSLSTTDHFFTSDHKTWIESNMARHDIATGGQRSGAALLVAGPLR